MIISAKEALELYENSDAFIQQLYLDKLDADIRQAAQNGKRELICSIKKLTETATEGEPLEPNSTQAKVIAELKRAKFRVDWAPIGEPFVPKGQQAEDGTGPKHVQWGIRLAW